MRAIFHAATFHQPRHGCVRQHPLRTLGKRKPSRVCSATCSRTAKAFVENLKNMLRETACKLDAEFPKHAGDVVIDNRGGISVKRTTAKEVPTAVDGVP